VAVNKNFVVKNGLEVNTQLILADANTNKVGIGSTAPRFELDVAGGIGATDMYVVGVSTVLETFNVGSGGNVLSVIAGSGGIGTSKVGIGTAIPAYVLDVRSPVSTGQTALYVQGDVRITGDLTVDDITFDQATINNLSVSQGTETQFLVVSGVSTYGGNLDINAAVDITGYTNIDDDVNITGTLNVGGATTVGGYLDVNASADISGTVNIGGATTIGGYLDVNDSIDATGTLSVGGATTIGGYLDVNDSSDISGTLNVGGATTIGGYLDVNDSSDAFLASTLNVESFGNWCYLVDTATSGTIGGYLDINADTDINGTLNVSGVSTLGTVQVSSGIITAASGIVTYYGDGSQLSGVIGGIGINTSGGLVGFGVTYLHLFGAGVSTAQYESSVGIATIFFEGGGGGGSISISTTAPLLPNSGDLWYSPDYARTFIYYDETVVGYGTDAYWVDAAPFNVGLLEIDDLSVSNLTVTNTFNVLGVSTLTSLDVGNVNSSGIITATAFVGDGSGLTGAGSTVFNDTTTNQEFFPLFTDITSGTITASGISTSKLTYNPSSGEVTAVDYNSTSDFNLKTNIQTVENSLEIVDNLRGVSFEWKENGNKSYGVIAQELEKVLPELVKGNDPKTVSYSGIIGVLIEAIKELKKEIEDLKRSK
jgi:hypothetical protein